MSFQALDAKEKLLGVINSLRQKNKATFTKHIEEISNKENIQPRDMFINNHLLLFTSAVVPKALASLLTSLLIQASQLRSDQEQFIGQQESHDHKKSCNTQMSCDQAQIRTSQLSSDHGQFSGQQESHDHKMSCDQASPCDPEMSCDVQKSYDSSTSPEVPQLRQDNVQTQLVKDPQFLECCLLETLRMFPPFFGGRRLVRKDITLQGKRIPAGHALVYMSYATQRDSEAFPDPDSFKPERWTENREEEKKKLSCFGSGPRCCIGQHLVWDILMTVTTKLLSTWELSIPKDQDLSYKWLPVSRPKNNISVLFSRR